MARPAEPTAAGRTVVERGSRVDAQRQMELFHVRVKQRGLKSTAQRDDIARVFFEIGHHISAEELYAEVKKISPHVGYATIYRTLRLLKECDLVSEVVSERHHDHFICERCGKIIEFQNENLERLQEAVARELNVTLTRHKMELYGLCPECLAQSHR
jgi:Fur family ferric uptake transcriptional regulator